MKKENNLNSKVIKKTNVVNVVAKETSKLIKPKLVKESLYRRVIFNFAYKEVGSILLENAIWKTEVNQKIVHNVIVSQQASWRLNTKKTKGRGEVSGGGKKPWRQKGTGRARHGSIRSPIWKGGGVVFGPSGQENYSKKVNRKVFRKGLQMILANCLENNKLIFWRDLDLKKPSTKRLNNILNIMSLQDKKVLFIIDDNKSNLLLSLRNLPKVKAISNVNINPYDLLHADKVLILDSLAPMIEKGCSL